MDVFGHARVPKSYHRTEFCDSIDATVGVGLVGEFISAPISDHVGASRRVSHVHA